MFFLVRFTHVHCSLRLRNRFHFVSRWWLASLTKMVSRSWFHVAIVRAAGIIFALAIFAPQVPFFAALPPSFAASLLYVQTPCQSHLLSKDCHFGRLAFPLTLYTLHSTLSPTGSWRVHNGLILYLHYIYYDITMRLVCDYYVIPPTFLSAPLFIGELSRSDWRVLQSTGVADLQRSDLPSTAALAAISSPLFAPLFIGELSRSDWGVHYRLTASRLASPVSCLPPPNPLNPTDFLRTHSQTFSKVRRNPFLRVFSLKINVPFLITQTGLFYILYILGIFERP